MPYPTVIPSPEETVNELVESYQQIAIRTFAAHHAHGVSCDCCGEHWPCSRACAAAAALSL